MEEAHAFSKRACLLILRRNGADGFVRYLRRFWRITCQAILFVVTHPLEITETFAGTAKWLPLLRASGCFAVLSYITNTEIQIPFPDIQAVLKRGEMQARAKDLIRCFASSGSEV